MRPPHRAVGIRIRGSMIAAILIFVGVVSKNLATVTSALSLRTTPKPNQNNDHNGGDPTTSPQQPTRRDLLLRTVPALIVPTTLLLSNPNLAAATENDPSSLTSPTRQDVPVVDSSTPRTYVITGATSGIGLEACQRLARSSGPQNTIVLVGRTLQRAQEAVDAVVAQSSTTAQLIPAACDLASLQSIDQFANDFLKGVTTIDTLCLNAGLCRNTNAKDCVRTKDGYELTVGVNHFGHFYLTHLLLPKLNANAGRIVVTASGVHDPDSPGGAQGETATLGDLDGLARLGRDCEMIDGGPFNADKAYKDSKV
jgi:protochlorophyllide reductase